MAKKETRDIISRAHLIILIVSLSIILITAIALFITALTPKEMDSKEKIAESIESFDEDEKAYKYASSYLEKLGIRGFDKTKFKTCESYFKEMSIYERSDKELALKTAELFLEYYYDEIDLNDKNALTDALITCYVTAYGDKYAVYRTQDIYDGYQQDMSGAFAGIGITVTYNEEMNAIEVLSVTDDSGAYEAGIRKGDFIIGAAGKTIYEIGYDELIQLIRGEVGEPVDITFIREGETHMVTAIRKQVVERTVNYSITEDKIGYVQITGFKGNTAAQFREAIDYLEACGAVGIIFDLRNNPGGYLDAVVNVIDYLVPDGTRIASYNKSGTETVFTAKDGHSVDLPMAVIFNGNTASAGELFSAAMRDYDKAGIIRSVSVGTTTFAKGIMQSTFTFSDGSALTLTTAYYNPPSDVNYDGIGVEPDFTVYEVSNGDAPLAAAHTEIGKLINSDN